MIKTKEAFVGMVWRIRNFTTYTFKVMYVVDLVNLNDGAKNVKHRYICLLLNDLIRDANNHNNIFIKVASLWECCECGRHRVAPSNDAYAKVQNWWTVVLDFYAHV